MIFVKQKTVLKTLLIAVAMAVASCLVAVLPAAAADYNCGAYGASTYSDQACAEGAAGAGGGALENTGQLVWPIVAAALLILAGTMLLFRTRKKMKARTAAQQQSIRQ